MKICIKNMYKNAIKAAGTLYGGTLNVCGKARDIAEKKFAGFR